MGLKIIWVDRCLPESSWGFSSMRSQPAPVVGPSGEEWSTWLQFFAWDRRCPLPCLWMASFGCREQDCDASCSSWAALQHQFDSCRIKCCTRSNWSSVRHLRCKVAASKADPTKYSIFVVSIHQNQKFMFCNGSDATPHCEKSSLKNKPATFACARSPSWLNELPKWLDILRIFVSRLNSHS